MYILGANMYILGVNMYILGANMYIVGVNMYILSVNYMYILGASLIYHLYANVSLRYQYAAFGYKSWYT